MMRVAHLSMTAIAGACWAWSEAFKEAGHDSFCCAPAGYGDGRQMPTDYEWPPTGEALDRINSADVLFCYQGYPYRFAWYPRAKPTVVIYVSQPQPHIWTEAQDDGWPWAVDGEYQTRLYPGSIPVPECLPLAREWFRPAAKPRDRVRIAYSPSNTGGRDGWDDKGYDQVRSILLKLVEDCDGKSGLPPIEADIITGIPLGECLLRKATAHIVIDECVTGAFHSNSIQGLAHGCVVLNNADELCIENVRTVTGGAEPPFSRCSMERLDAVLRRFCMIGPLGLEAVGRNNRTWMETHWQARALIERNFLPLMERALDRAAKAPGAVHQSA